MKATSEERYYRRLEYRHSLSARYRKASGITQNRRDLPLIVSLTTIPERLKTLHLCIESLLCQTVKPDGLTLWVSHEIQETQIPQMLRRQEKRGLQIRFCEDIGPYTKIIHSLKEYPESLIVIADDDVMYPKHWLQALYESYQQTPECIHAYHAPFMTLDEHGALEKFSDWPEVPGLLGPSLFLFGEGVGGVLYPPGVFHQDVFRQDIFLRLCPSADDIWLKAMSLRNGVLCRKVSPLSRLPLMIKGTQEKALKHLNIAGGMNDSQLRAVFDYYDVFRIIAEKHPFLNGRSLEGIQYDTSSNLRLRYIVSVQQAWRHWSAGEFERIVPALRQSLVYMPASSAEAILYSWVTLIGKWCHEEEWSCGKFQELWSFFTQVLSFEPSERCESLKRLVKWWITQGFFFQYHDIRELHLWRRALQKALPYEPALDIPAEKILDWWSELWYQYWGSGNTTLPAYPLEAPIDLELYIELLQQLLAVSNKPVSLPELARLWQDLLTQGIIPMSSRYRITSLYLTVFGQAIIKHRNWRIGREALTAALKLSWHPQALKAWGKFLSNTVSYLKE